MAHEHSPRPDTSKESGAPVARRLWADLFCMCGECEQITLADCACNSAALERKRIAAKVGQLGNGTPSRDDATYARILSEYLELHGPNAEVRYPRRHAWLHLLAALAAVVAGFTVVVILVERFRSGRNANASKASARQQPRPMLLKKKRKKHH
jgi:hypothetical protein